MTDCHVMLMRKYFIYAINIVTLIFALLFSSLATGETADSNNSSGLYGGSSEYSLEELTTFDGSEVKENNILLDEKEALECAIVKSYLGIRDELAKRLLFKLGGPTATSLYPYTFMISYKFMFSYKPYIIFDMYCGKSNYPLKYEEKMNDEVYKNPTSYINRANVFFDQSLDMIEQALVITVNKEKVKEAQQLLNHLGYKAGAADGVFGLKTSEAISAFGANKEQATIESPANYGDSLSKDAFYGVVTDNVLHDLRACKQQKKCYAK